MKKITLIIKTLMLVTFLSQAKINGYYSIYYLGPSISCSITFFDENYYYIELNNSLSLDVVEVDILSFGSFSQSKNKLSLTDAVSGYEMQLEVLNEKQIKVNKGFSFLENKLLTNQGLESVSASKHYKDFYFKKAKTEFSIQKEINRYNLDGESYILRKGLYFFAKYKH
jgi:hypothetical protein